MLIHSELGDLRSEGIYFKNKYKFLTPKVTFMPQIKQAFVWSVNTKSTLKYPFEFCSDVSFISKLFSRNWHLLYVLILLTFYSLLVTWCTNSLTFPNSTQCPHCIYTFCIYLRTNGDLCHLQHKLIGFYNRDEKCLQRGTDWVFK